MCEGEYVILYVTVSGSPPPVLTWYHNNESINTDPSIEVIGRDGTLSIPSMEERHVGIYRLVASNSYGSCYEELELTIEDEDTFTLRRVESIASMIDNAPVPVSSFGEYVALHHRKSNEAFQFQFLVKHYAFQGVGNDIRNYYIKEEVMIFDALFFVAVSEYIHRYAFHCWEHARKQDL